MKMKKGILLLLLLFCFDTLLAQAIKVAGTVTDAQNEPLPGVSIILEGTNQGTTTDVFGKYTIEVPSGAKLIFNYIGYVTQPVSVNNRSVIDITMQEDIAQLSEVVVVGYGSMERTNVTGAISSIKAEDINKVPVPNAIEALRGQVPGVRISRTSGMPGSGVSMKIRGTNSLTSGNDPLIVLDGVPLTGGNMADINPNDIETLNVLKDAAAASIYGASGANGVILITTKRGKSGKPTVSVNFSTGFTQLSMTPEMFNADEYVQLKLDAAAGAGNPKTINEVLNDPVERQNYIDGKSIDWHEQLLRTGSVTNAGVTVSGGSEKLTFYLNNNLYREIGVVQNSDYTRYSLRLNSDYKAADFLKIGANLQISASDADETGNTLDQNGNADFNDFVGNTPLGRTHDENGDLVPTVKGDQFQYNPLFRYQESDISRQNTRVFINPYVEVDIVKGLKYRLNAFAEARDEKYNRFLSTEYNDGAPNYSRIQLSRNMTYLLDNILTYSTTLNEKHNLNATAVYGMQLNKYYNLNTQARSAATDELDYNAIGSTSSETSTLAYSLNDWSKVYFVGRAGYSYDDRYNLTLTMRVDGSSKFGENNRFGTFPSVAGAWNIHNESFLEDSPVDMLKLRASYGIMGNDNIPNFRYMSLAQAVRYSDANGIHTGFTTSTAPNADLRWEESNQFNTGIDFGFLNGRIGGSLDYYKTQTKDLLLTEKLPITSGYEQVLSNVGRTENWGIDFALKADVIDGPIKWNVSANWSMDRNKIVSLNRASTDDEGNPIDDTANGWFIGQPIGVLYEYDFLGIYQAGEESTAAAMHPTIAGYGPGDPKIRDVNGDGVITTDDRTFLGSSNPKWYGGLNNTVSYKGFELSVLFEMVQGVKKINYYYGSLTGRDNTIKVDYWTPENPSNEFPEPHETDNYYFANAVKVRDASFISLRNVSLSYNLPPSILEKMHLQSVNLYMRGNNLHYFTDYKDSYSPEVDAFNFPTMKSVTFGTKVVF
ncbi:TonB-dependent receptor [Limibacter armeniacum]|uniref:SusC/RagA family TonB-linked outer membrane protein n=1 Tax=Limibacter armeniacum TaxID=466084 RepID=UPI002FE59681